MLVSQEGRKFIEGWEDKKYKVYTDIAGYLTVGIGHRVRPEDKLYLGDTISEQRVQELFERDLQPIDALLNHYSLTQNQHDALACLIFNIGVGNFMRSTMKKMLDNKMTAEASGQFKEWVYVKKQKVDALVLRRTRERDVYEKAIYNSKH